MSWSVTEVQSFTFYKKKKVVLFISFPRRRTMQNLALYASILVITVLPLVGSSEEHVKPRHASNKGDIEEMSPKLVSEITVHGFLLWASMGFFMPFGILTIRMANREECGTRLKLLFYVHAVSQIVSVVLATAGAVMSIRNFNNSFNNGHQRIGVALYALIYLQVFTGFLRPKRGCNGRRRWFIVHWMLGTSMCLLGVISIYTGLQAYHEKTSRSIRFWTLVFSVEMSLMAFLYLFQDKWLYIKRQGLVLDTTSPQLPQTWIYKHKVHRTAEPC